MESLQLEPESKKSTDDWPFSFFLFDEKRGDSLDQVRSAVLVVAALVATASFQAAMDPSDKVLESSRGLKVTFFCFTTLAWSCSMSIIEMLTAAFPFKRELRLSYIAMGAAFGISVVRHAEIYGGASTGAFLACSFLPYIIRWLPYHIKTRCH